MGTTYATNTGKRTGKTYVRQHERKKKSKSNTTDGAQPMPEGTHPARVGMRQQSHQNAARIGEVREATGTRPVRSRTKKNRLIRRGLALQQPWIALHAKHQTQVLGETGEPARCEYEPDQSPYIPNQRR